MSRVDLTIQEEFEAALSRRLKRQAEQLAIDHQLEISALEADHQTKVRSLDDQHRGDLDRLATRIRELVGRLTATELGFIGPALAVRAAKVNELEVTGTGQIDEEELRRRLEDLASREPYMVHPAYRPGRLIPDPTQGTNNTKETQ